MSGEIFISFASKDHRVAMTICNALESRGFSCWISARDIAPGENFQESIVRAIRHAKIMLLIFTSNSNNSDEVKKELALASQGRMIVVPLRIEDVAPNEAFTYEFATRQWIDFFADWEFAIQQLATRIQAATGSEPKPPLAEPAAEPVRVEAPAVLTEAAVDSPPAGRRKRKAAEDPQPDAASDPALPSLPGAANDAGDEASAAPRAGPGRAAVAWGLTAIVIAAGAAMLWSRGGHESAPAHPARAMALVPSAPPAPPIQRASTAPQLQAAPAAAPEATPAADPEAAAAPDKPAPAKRRAHPKKSDESYVPY